MIEKGKLVRDKIPDIIRAKGEMPVTRTLDDTEYRRALLNKLIEEATELRDSDGSLEERADVAEVLSAIDTTFGFTAGAIEAARSAKADERGGFVDRIWLGRTKI